MNSKEHTANYTHARLNSLHSQHQLHEKQEEEIGRLKEQLQRLSVAFAGSMQEKEEMGAVTMQQRELFSLAHKHVGLQVEGAAISNSSQDCEVRWALLGPAVSTERKTYFRLRVHEAAWVAVGFCHRQQLQRRKYSRFNGNGGHGAYVMDSTGWVYADGHSSNYRPDGFPLVAGDEVCVVYDPREGSVSVVNAARWSKCELSLRVLDQQLFPCVACSGRSRLSLLEYQA